MGWPPLLCAEKYRYFSSLLQTKFPLVRSKGMSTLSLAEPCKGIMARVGMLTNEVLPYWNDSHLPDGETCGELKFLPSSPSNFFKSVPSAFTRKISLSRERSGC